jgi:O-glycosyl hydrolase
MVRVDLSPNYVAPYSNNSYNCPGYNVAGPDGNYVRSYTGLNGSQPYTASFNGSQAQIAVMGPPAAGNDISANIAQLDFTGATMASAGALAQQGQSAAMMSQLGDFKLFGSFWSPPPWLKIASGNTFNSNFTAGPSNGAAFPFIWLGCFAGGLFDTSGTSEPQYNNTSALTQFARTVSATLRGFQQTYGVKFNAISIQNELDFEEYYNSCLYESTAQYIAVLNAVRTELNQYPDLANIQIEGPEDAIGTNEYEMWQTENGSTPIARNLQFVSAVESQAPASLGFFTVHGYGPNGISSTGVTTSTSWQWWTSGWTPSSNPSEGLPTTVSGISSYGRKSWMTEASGETDGWLDSSTSGGFPDSGAFSIAIKLHQALTTGQESGWVYWQFNDGSTPADGQALVDTTNMANSPKYVAAKHFFRYIRPYSYRVNTTVTGSSKLLASSYVNDANGTLTIVLLNTSSSSTTASITVPTYPAGLTSFQNFTSSNGKYWQPSTTSVSGGKMSVSLPGYSAVTLTATSPGETYANWAAGYFGSSSSANAAPNATPQNDGVTNLVKYFCDINPTRAMSATDLSALPKVTVTTVGGFPYLALNYRQNPNQTGLGVVLESSPDLQTWQNVQTQDDNDYMTQAVGNDSTTGDPIIQQGIKTNGNTKLFVRLNVTLP